MESDGRLVCYAEGLRVVVSEDQRTIIGVYPRAVESVRHPEPAVESVGRGKKGKGGHKYPTTVKSVYEGVSAAEGWDIQVGRHGTYAISPTGGKVRLPVSSGRSKVLKSTIMNVCTALKHEGLDLRS